MKQLNQMKAESWRGVKCLILPILGAHTGHYGGGVAPVQTEEGLVAFKHDRHI